MIPQENLLLTDIEGEIWKPIKESSNYLVSNKQRVKAISFERSNGFSLYHTKEKIKKQCLDGHGYWVISVSTAGKPKTLRVHRLIMEAFKENPNHLPFVNHEDGNKLNNATGNMNWCDSSENNRHAYKKGLKKANKGVPNKKNWKPVLQIKDDSVLKLWDGVVLASKELNIKAGCISAVANNKYNTYKGYRWLYLTDYEKQKQTTTFDNV